MLEVAGDGADGTGGVGNAFGGTEATASRVTGVGGLGPGVAGIEREVDAGGPDAGCERTRGGVTRVARLEIDVVVRAGEPGRSGARRRWPTPVRSACSREKTLSLLPTVTSVSPPWVAKRRCRHGEHEARAAEDGDGRDTDRTPARDQRGRTASWSRSNATESMVITISHRPTRLFPPRSNIVRPWAATSTVAEGGSRTLEYRGLSGCAREGVNDDSSHGGCCSVPGPGRDRGRTDDRWGGVGGEQGHGG